MISIQSLYRSILASAFLLCGLIGFVNGQDDTAKTELGLRQRLIQMKMVEVEKKFQTMADSLQAEKPEQAKLLTEAYQRSKEGLITSKMAEATALLNQNRLDEARKVHVEVRDELDKLVRLLTQREEPTISKQQEIERLEQTKAEIEEQIRQQQQQTSEAYKASNKEKAVEKLKSQIKDLDELAKKQQELMEATEQNGKPSLRELDAIADRQFEIRKQTERLKNELKKLGGETSEEDPSDAKGDSVDGDQKPSDNNSDQKNGQPSTPGGKSSGESGESKPQEKPGQDDKPIDQKPRDEKSGDQKPGDEKSGDDQSEAKSPQDKPQDSSKPSGDGQEPSGDQQGQQSQKSQQGQQGQKGQQQPPQPGQQALDQAQKEQAKAEEKLGSAKPEDAAKNQGKAIQEINKAKAELEKEKRRIESLPKEALEKLAEDQRRLRDKAMEVVAEMKKAKKSKPDPSQEQPAEDQSNPGEQAMKEAGEAQKQAADAMENNDSEEAQENQQKAEQKMKKAVDEIEERLAQLKDETREEKLARLESRFNEMLERQRATSAMTMEIQDRRSVLDGLQHRDQLVLLRLANNEAEINESAQQAYDLLLEDGTSVVFPEVVADMQLELTNATELLTDEKTGSYTQLVQKEIEATIEDLVDALKKAKDDEKKDGGGGGGGGGGGDQPLLKKSAELKVLRMQQLRLNRRTQNIEKLRGQPEVDDSVVSKEIESAAQLQQKLIEMTDQIID